MLESEKHISIGNKLDSKRNLPLLSKAIQKNSTNQNNKFLYTGMLQYPLPITCPKTSDYLYNKGEFDMNLNLVTESKVTECNRMSLTICTQKSVSQARQQELAGLHQMSFPEHVSEMPEMCPDTRGALHIIEK